MQLLFCTCRIILYLESSDGPLLGCLPPTRGKNLNIGKLAWICVLLTQQGLILYHQRKYVFGPPLRLAYLHRSPFINDRQLLFWNRICLSRATDGCSNVDSVGLREPEGRSIRWSSAGCHVQNLSKPVCVVFWIDFKRNSPLFGEDGEGCQKVVELQHMLFWKIKYSQAPCKQYKIVFS